MSIAWEHFTPYSALGGGALIGLAAALMVLLEGRIAGISGITGGLLSAGGRERGWRAAFLGGLLISPWLYAAAAALPPGEIAAGSGWLAIAGLLVGVGTRLGSGCTSGHGVCGTARLSPRSLVATGLFMAAGMAVVALVRHGVAA